MCYISHTKFRIIPHPAGARAIEMCRCTLLPALENLILGMNLLVALKGPTGLTTPQPQPFLVSRSSSN